MKVAYFAESPADQTALTILTESILGQATDLVIHSGLRHRGWPAVKGVLPAVLKQLHWHSEAEGFVFVVDSNSSSPHLSDHEQEGNRSAKCRLCQVRDIAEQVMQEIRPRQNLPPLKIALGVAVPTIEAWLLCGVDPHVTEAAWINGMKEGRVPFLKQSLKEKLYGTSHPPLSAETDAMSKAARRLASDIASIEKLFPLGFGALARDLKGW